MWLTTTMNWVVILVLYQSVTFSLAEKKTNPPPSKVLDFMKQYGYLKNDTGTSAALYTEEGLTEAIKTVQKFGAIEQTGKLDSATLKLMASPRCGNADVLKSKRSRRFTFGSEGWNKRFITYYIANWSSKLGEEKVARLIQKALRTWGEYGALKFSRKRTPDADIIVSFARGHHNDPYPFDGPGSVLAHAYFPNDGSELGGDIHFDDDEEWVESTPNLVLERGTDFYTVALHELGHSLGLGHSTDRNAIMYPYYKGDDDSALHLGHDDIMGMYELYIRRPIDGTIPVSTTEKYIQARRTRPTQRTFTMNTPSTTEKYISPRRTKPTQRTSTTNTPYYDPSTWSTTKYLDSDKYPSINTDSTTTYYTKEYPYNRRTSFQSYDPYSRTWSDFSSETKEYDVTNGQKTISSSTSIPVPNICGGHFDAVANLRGELFIFKGQYIWRMRDRYQIVNGYPVYLEQMFPKLPKTIEKVNAAYERPDGNMILFTDDQYWVYDGVKFVENSPRSIKEYGFPPGSGGVDAAFTWGRNGKTYLFKNDRFWRYDEEKKLPEVGYPKPVTVWKGIPINLDGAITWKDGSSYFLKGDKYWRLDNNLVQVTKDSPRSFTRDWLAC